MNCTGGTVGRWRHSIATTSERVHAEVVLGRELRVRVFDGADVVQVGGLIQVLVGGAPC